MTDHLADKQIDLAAYERQAQQVLHYDASAPNAWCNTLLFTKDQFDDRLTALPGGIGLSNLFNELEPNVPFRSRYLLMSEATYQRFSGRPDAPPLELLASLSADSNLYLNKNAACDVTS